MTMHSKQPYLTLTPEGKRMPLQRGGGHLKTSPGSVSLLPGILATLLAVVFGVFWLSALGIGLFVYLFSRFILEFTNVIPVDTLLLLVAALQWIIGPLLSYAGLAPHYKYYMYVDEASYMSLAVPGTMCLVTGVYMFRKRMAHEDFEHLIHTSVAILRREKSLPLILILIGGFLTIVRGFLPASLSFVGYLGSNGLYIGVIHALFSDNRNKWMLLVGALSLMFLTSLAHGVFHDLILWTTLLGLFIGFKYKWPVLTRLLTAAACIFVVFTLHVVKVEYRKVLREGASNNQIALFAELTDELFWEDNSGRFEDDAVSLVVIRINQGWIISRIMEQVPAHRPFADGDTVRAAVRAALLPRFLAPEKAKAGGKQNFLRFTGFRLYGTSMGLSVLGEAYANYGKNGALIFLLVYGVCISLFLRALLTFALKHPIAIFWLPFVFLHPIKAETELAVTLNYLVKSTIVAVAFIWFSEEALRAKVMHVLPHIWSPPHPEMEPSPQSREP